MTIGRRDVNPPVFERLAVGRMDRGQAAGTGQDIGQQAAAARDMQHDADRGADVARQIANDVADGLDASGRGADDDDVVLSHSGGPARRKNLQTA